MCFINYSAKTRYFLHFVSKCDKIFSSRAENMGKTVVLKIILLIIEAKKMLSNLFPFFLAEDC